MYWRETETVSNTSGPYSKVSDGFFPHPHLGDYSLNPPTSNWCIPFRSCFMSCNKNTTGVVIHPVRCDGWKEIVRTSLLKLHLRKRVEITVYMMVLGKSHCWVWGNGRVGVLLGWDSGRVGYDCTETRKELVNWTILLDVPQILFIIPIVFLLSPPHRHLPRSGLTTYVLVLVDVQSWSQTNIGREKHFIW